VTSEPDLYQVLEVPPSADATAIRSAYRRLARRFHPDVAPLAQPDAVRRMSEINRAWEILRDPARRAAYDRQRSAPDSGYVAPRRAARTSGGGGRPSGDHGRGASPSPGSGSGTRPTAGAGGTAGGAGPAGPPPGHPSGTVLRFGRYAGWSLGEISRRDPDFLEWLERTSAGRPYRDEIDALLRRIGRRQPAADPLARPGRFRG
jgi:curved DNA-binding protein CbpA